MTRSSHKKRKETGLLVASFMESLPSTHLLRYAITQDLLVKWFGLRDDAINYGACLKARFVGGGNPALKALKTGQIDKTDYEIVMAFVDWYESIFNLIQGGWEYIEETLSNWYSQTQTLNFFPKTDIEMYFAILRELWDSKFIQCIEGGKFTIQRNENQCRLVATAGRFGIQLEESPTLVQLRDGDREKLKHTQDLALKHTPWLLIATGICFKKAELEDDDPLRRLSREYLRKQQHLNDKLSHALSIERKKKPGRFFSAQWKEGLQRQGTRGGFK